MCMNGRKARTCGSRQRPGEILAFLLIQNRGGAASKIAVEVTKNRFVYNFSPKAGVKPPKARPIFLRLVRNIGGT